MTHLKVTTLCKSENQRTLFDADWIRVRAIRIRNKTKYQIIVDGGGFRYYLKEEVRAYFAPQHAGWSVGTRTHIFTFSSLKQVDALLAFALVKWSKDTIYEEI